MYVNAGDVTDVPVRGDEGGALFTLRLKDAGNELMQLCSLSKRRMVVVEYYPCSRIETHGV